MNDFSVYLIIIVTAVLVHSIKFLRIYLAFYGSGMKLKECLKTFCIAAPVSMLIPFKLGEIFRIFAYGKRVKSYLIGLIVIILDRFMDTAALLTVMLLFFVFNGSRITLMAYFFLIFLVLVLWIYIMFPHIHTVWKKSLLLAKATEHKLELLAFLDRMNKIFCEIENVVKGRGFILYFLSLLAWIIEIGGIGSIVLFNNGIVKDVISQYLSAAMTGIQSILLRKMILVSVCILIGLFVVLLILDLVIGKEEKA